MTPTPAAAARARGTCVPAPARLGVPAPPYLPPPPPPPQAAASHPLPKVLLAWVGGSRAGEGAMLCRAVPDSTPGAELLPDRGCGSRRRRGQQHVCPPPQRCAPLRQPLSSLPLPCKHPAFWGPHPSPRRRAQTPRHKARPSSVRWHRGSPVWEGSPVRATSVAAPREVPALHTAAVWDSGATTARGGDSPHELPPPQIQPPTLLALPGGWGTTEWPGCGTGPPWDPAGPQSEGDKVALSHPWHGGGATETR